jgi:hypothetical protein
MRGMFSGVMAMLFIAGVGWAFAAAHAPEIKADVTLSGPMFPVGNLQFTLPAKWQIEQVESPARGGQWRVPPLKPDGEGGEVVVFYFGAGVGGSAKENIEAWIGTMSNPEGHSAASELKHRQSVTGFKISQVVIFGTYNQAVTEPGVPPQMKTNYGLLGAVIDNPQGNIYWRFTGPEALIAATLPLFNKVIDSVKLAPTLHPQ